MNTKIKTVAGLFIVVVTTIATINQAVAADDFFKKAKDLLRNKGSETTTQNVVSALSNDDIVAGLREALSVGASKVVGQLGKTDGFNKDAAIHIPLPSQMDKVKSALSKVGMSGSLDDLETRMNRAAEAATPIAKDLFMQSIKDMSLSDAKGILQGGDDAATQYFKRTMSPALSSKMQPIVQEQLSKAGAVKVYDQVLGKYNDLPFVSKVDMNLNDHVVKLTIDGIFHYLAQEEAAIRKNPVARTTDLLKKVFGK